MKLGLRALYVALGAWLSVAMPGCPSPSAPPNDADAAPATCIGFCASLELAGCPEANPKGTTCKAKCQQIVDARLTTLPLKCVVDAATKDQIRACGIRCAD